jgi:hypothetical protein
VEEHKPEMTTPDPRRVAKRAYSTPRLSSFGSVEMLSLSGTGVMGETPGNKSTTKKP